MKGRLEEKLSPQERSLVQLLERKGPQGSEQAGLFLGVKPKSVSVLVSTANKALPGLIENVQGRYVSRLAKLFPVTEELKAEAKEIESLRILLADRMKEIVDLKNTIQAVNADYAKLNQDLRITIKERDEFAKRLKEAESSIIKRESLEESSKRMGFTEGPPLPVPMDETRIREIVREELSARSGSGIPVDVALKRTISEFNVSTSREVLEADETSWEGKLLACGLKGLFDEPKGIGKIMQELVRRYNVGDSGGNRTTVNDRLAMLVTKGILDRRQESGQWVYLATPEFKERVKKA